MNNPTRFPHRRTQAGFTLVELGLVVVILSILGMMAVQAYRRTSIRSRTSVVLNDFRVIGGAVNAYSLEKGAWPPSAAPGVLPAALQGYVTASNFTSPSPIGGYYTWATN